MFEEWYLMNNNPNNSYLNGGEPNYYDECSLDMFNELLLYSPDRKQIKKDSFDFVGIIQYHANPLNEHKEDKKLLCALDIDLKRGDTLSINNEYWLVLSDIEKNTVYQKCKIRKANNILTLEYKNNIYKIPCVLNNATLYSDGLEIKEMTLSNDQRGCLVPYNDLTKQIKLQQRFLFNHNSAFSVSLIDDFSFKQVDENSGLLQLTMIREIEKSNLDDFTNNLADNSHLKKEIPITLQIDNKTIQLEVNKTYQLNPKLLQGNKEINSQEELNKIVYTIDNNLIAKVENGIITSLTEGSTNIQISYNGQVIIIPLQIVNTSVNGSNCNIIGNDFIKIGKLGMWNVELYNNNGNKVNGKVEWEIVGNDIDNLIKIKEKTDNSITLLAYRNQENIGKKFTIKCKTLDGLSYDSQEIILKSLI